MDFASGRVRKVKLLSWKNILCRDCTFLSFERASSWEKVSENYYCAFSVPLQHSISAFIDDDEAVAMKMFLWGKDPVNCLESLLTAEEKAKQKKIQESLSWKHNIISIGDIIEVDTVLFLVVPPERDVCPSGLKKLDFVRK